MIFAKTIHFILRVHHQRHWIAKFTSCLIANHFPFIVLNIIFTRSISLTELDSHSNFTKILSNFNLTKHLQWIFFRFSFLPRKHFYSSIEYSFSKSIFYIRCDYSNHDLILFFIAQLACQINVWQKHDFLFLFFQFLFFWLPYSNLLDLILLLLTDFYFSLFQVTVLL